MKLRQGIKNQSHQAKNFIASGINGVEVLLASTSQADKNVFLKTSVGRQCLAIGLKFLARASMKSDEERWNVRELNAILLEGDELYNGIIARCLENCYQPAAGYLEPRDLHYIGNRFTAFSKQWSVDFDDADVRISFNFLSATAF